MTSLTMSKQDRMDSFKKNMDWHINKPYYGGINKACSSNSKCDATEKNIIAISSNGDPLKECVTTLYVDTSKKGIYKHPTNGMEFNIDGIVTKWVYDSSPELCLVTISWWGPW